MELEGFSFTLPASEAAAVYLLVTAAGFPATSQGLKEYLLLTAGVTEANEEKVVQDESDLGREDLSDKIRKIVDLAERNPQVTEYALKKGSQLLGTLFKRFG